MSAYNFKIGDEVWNNQHARHGVVTLRGSDGGVLVHWTETDPGVENWELPESLNLCAGQGTHLGECDPDATGGT